MMKLLVVALQLLALSIFAEAQEDTVVLLHVLFRHGNRAADKSGIFPTDPHINDTYDPFKYSQLTLKGKQTEYKIGKYIRSTYGGLIPEQYLPDTVYAISTNFKRTKMSLELVLSALFPPLANETIEDGLNWQPIPFNIEPGQGLIGVASAYCAAFASAYGNYLVSRDAQKAMIDWSGIYTLLKKYAGVEVNSPRQAASVYFTLKSEEDFGLSLPSWTRTLYPQPLEDAAALDYEFSTATPTLKKLTSGFLLKKIIQDSLDKANGLLTEDRKIFVYSAHEFNVATMLRALNVYFTHVPPFGATIYFEIHNVGGVFGLKIKYEDYTEDAPKVLVIPGCDEVCPLDQLQELVKDSIPGVNDVCDQTTELM